MHVDKAVQRQSWLKVYNILAAPSFSYGRGIWTLTQRIISSLKIKRWNSQDAQQDTLLYAIEEMIF